MVMGSAEGLLTEVSYVTDRGTPLLLRPDPSRGAGSDVQLRVVGPSRTRDEPYEASPLGGSRLWIGRRF